MKLRLNAVVMTTEVNVTRGQMSILCILCKVCHTTLRMPVLFVRRPSAKSQPLNKPLHPNHRLLEVLHARGVSAADKALAARAERRAGHDRYFLLAQQFQRKIL